MYTGLSFFFAHMAKKEATHPTCRAEYKHTSERLSYIEHPSSRWLHTRWCHSRLHNDTSLSQPIGKHFLHFKQEM